MSWSGKSMIFVSRDFPAQNEPRVIVEGFSCGPGKRRAALGSLSTTTAFRR